MDTLSMQLKDKGQKHLMPTSLVELQEIHELLVTSLQAQKSQRVKAIEQVVTDRPIFEKIRLTLSGAKKAFDKEIHKFQKEREAVLEGSVKLYWLNKVMTQQIEFLNNEVEKKLVSQKSEMLNSTYAAFLKWETNRENFQEQFAKNEEFIDKSDEVSRVQKESLGFVIEMRSLERKKNALLVKLETSDVAIANAVSANNLVNFETQVLAGTFAIPDRPRSASTLSGTYGLKNFHKIREKIQTTELKIKEAELDLKKAKELMDLGIKASGVPSRKRQARVYFRNCKKIIVKYLGENQNA